MFTADGLWTSCPLNNFGNCELLDAKKAGLSEGRGAGHERQSCEVNDSVPTRLPGNDRRCY
jgi:hypothetical protein